MTKVLKNRIFSIQLLISHNGQPLLHLWKQARVYIPNLPLFSHQSFTCSLIVPPITPVDQIEKKEDTATTLQDANSEYMAYLSRKHQEQLRVATQRALDPNGHLQKLDSLLDHIDKRQNDTQSEKESKNEVKATSTKWVQYIDPTSQSVYYYNMDTGKKQYDMPNDHVVSGVSIELVYVGKLILNSVNCSWQTGFLLKHSMTIALKRMSSWMEFITPPLVSLIV